MRESEADRQMQRNKKIGRQKRRQTAHLYPVVRCIIFEKHIPDNRGEFRVNWMYECHIFRELFSL